jgi:hypothetical protein
MAMAKQSGLRVDPSTARRRRLAGGKTIRIDATAFEANAALPNAERLVICGRMAGRRSNHPRGPRLAGRLFAPDRAE